MSVRVKVCLGKIFKDHRREAFVNVSSSFVHVHNLEEHIRQIFNIKPNIYLTIENVLLPSNESIHVICTGDIIKINTISTDSNDECSIQQSTTNTTLTTYPNSESTQSEVSFTRSADSTLTNSIDTIDPIKRHRRIRKRKRKGKDENVGQIEDNNVGKEKTNDKNNSLVEVRSQGKPNSVAEVTCQGKPNRVVEVDGKPKSHIRFYDSELKMDTTKAEPSNPAALHSLARVIRPMTVLSDAGSFKQIKPASPNNVGHWKNSLIKLKEFANDENFMKVKSDIDFQIIKENVESSKHFVNLEKDVDPYDIIGFKILRIGENYEPQLSDWLIGMIKEVDELNISTYILAGKKETTGPVGKLSMELSDEETDEPDTVNFKRSEMLNVKVFSE